MTKKLGEWRSPPLALYTMHIMGRQRERLSREGVSLLSREGVSLLSREGVSLLFQVSLNHLPSVYLYIT